ncbi:MAG: type II secretion system protein, partial [Acidimicrobiales bacterium]|nr:type II secretion system protein [Acidimicrobiales bacterium]
MRAPRASDDGFSLIEVLVTVAIVGITFIVFVGGMGTSFLASDYHRKQAVVHASVRNFAEAVKAAPFSTKCPTDAPNEPAATYARAFSPPPPERPRAAALAAATRAHVAPSITPSGPHSYHLAFFAFGGDT